MYVYRVHMLQLHSLCGGIEYMLALAHFFEDEAALLGFYPESYSWRLDYYQHLWIMASKSRKQIFRPEYTTKWPCPVTFDVSSDSYRLVIVKVREFSKNTFFCQKIRFFPSKNTFFCCWRLASLSLVYLWALGCMLACHVKTVHSLP